MDEQKNEGGGPKDYRQGLSDQAYLSARELDNGVTLVATGALVLSIGFVDKCLSPFEATIIRWSWACLLACLLVHLASHWLSKRSLEKQVDLVDKGTPDKKNRWTLFVNVSNIVARSLLVAGIVLLVIYAYSGLRVGEPQEGTQVPNKCTCVDDSKKE